MKKILYIVISLLLICGVSVGSELSTLVAEHNVTQADITIVLDSIALVADSLEAQNDYTWQSLRLPINFATDGWNEEAPHEMFSILGSVEFYFTAYCSTTVTTTNATDSLHLFYPMVSTKALSLEGDQIATTEVLINRGYDFNVADPGPSQGVTQEMYTTWWTGIAHDISGAAASWDYDLDGGAFTGGIIVLLVRWRAQTKGSVLAAGTGL